MEEQYQRGSQANSVLFFGFTKIQKTLIHCIEPMPNARIISSSSSIYSRNNGTDSTRASNRRLTFCRWRRVWIEVFYRSFKNRTFEYFPTLNIRSQTSSGNVSHGTGPIWHYLNCRIIYINFVDFSFIQKKTRTKLKYGDRERGRSWGWRHIFWRIFQPKLAFLNLVVLSWSIQESHFTHEELEPKSTRSNLLYS